MGTRGEKLSCLKIESGANANGAIVYLERFKIAFATHPRGNVIRDEIDSSGEA